MNRRKFSKTAIGLAVAAPALAGASLHGQAPTQNPPMQEPPPAAPAPKYGMSKEQEDRVKQSVERSERGRGALRSFPLAYSAEPSFVFRAQVKAKP